MPRDFVNKSCSATSNAALAAGVFSIFRLISKHNCCSSLRSLPTSQSIFSACSATMVSSIDSPTTCLLGLALPIPVSPLSAEISTKQFSTLVTVLNAMAYGRVNAKFSRHTFISFIFIALLLIVLHIFF